MSRMCIDTAVRAASNLEYSCTLISDACAISDLFFDEKTVKAAEVYLAYMAAINGTFANVVQPINFSNQYIRSN